jgi:hypothetical protein
MNQYSRNISFVDVCYYYHCICVRERYKLDVIFIESYRYMRPLSLHDWAFDCHMIYLAIVLSSLSLVLETQVGASGDCVDGFEGWKISALLESFLVLWWRWGWVVWLCFWLDCLGVHCGICYLQGCRRVSDGWLGCVDLVCMWSVGVWLVSLS